MPVFDLTTFLGYARFTLAQDYWLAVLAACVCVLVGCVLRVWGRA